MILFAFISRAKIQLGKIRCGKNENFGKIGKIGKNENFENQKKYARNSRIVMILGFGLPKTSRNSDIFRDAVALLIFGIST
jgi:hypothetical protein